MTIGYDRHTGYWEYLVWAIRMLKITSNLFMKMWNKYRENISSSTI